MKSMSALIRRRPRLTPKPTASTPPAPTATTTPAPAARKTPGSPARTVPAPPFGTAAQKGAETDRRDLYEAGTLRRLPEGAALFDRSTNTDADKWHLVLSGSVRIVWVDSGQSGSTTLEEGQWLGPSADAA